MSVRVLYDISMLGLGQVSIGSRGGSYRADRHIVQGLITSGECELQACANHSALAWQGASTYLREHLAFAHVPLLGGPDHRAGSRLSDALVAGHRLLRRVAGTRPFPRLVRRGGSLVNRTLHPPVTDGCPPVDILHSPAVPLPPRARSGRSPQRLLTVYDLSYLRFPHLYGAVYREVMNAALHSVREDDWVITSSQSTRSELAERGVAPLERIFVSPLAADTATFYHCGAPDALQAMRARYGIPDRPYLLSVNSPDPRKNVAHAVRAFGNLVQQERIADLVFVLAGSHGPGSDSVRVAADALPVLRGRIITPGFVADADLAALYTGAMALVYPSIYEGFGLPPLEAMQCGTPVIASCTSSLPEVVGDAGILLDPTDADGLCAALLDLYRSESLRSALSKASIARAACFSWEGSTQQTLAAYRSALAG